MVPKAEILDCTLRDGGYYVGWDFSLDLARRYLESLSRSGIRKCEIGFRLTGGKGYLGAFAFSKESTLARLISETSPSIGVMLNTAEFKSGDAGVGEFFTDARDSSLDFVRLATDAADLDVALRLGENLFEMGYEVGLNLMQASELEPDELSVIARRANNEGVFQWLYLADSLGTMLPDQVASAFASLGPIFHGSLGFHGHDNLGLALANSLFAIQNGAEIVDGTITGMGRGAGNTKTEELLVLMSESKSPDSLRELDLISSSEFLNLKSKYRWGSSIPYGVAALEGIHPTFVQEMLEGEKFAVNREDVLGALANLKSLNARKFNESILRNASIEETTVSAEESIGDLPPGFLGNDPVLIVGPGPSVSKHSEALLDWVAQKNATVLSLNLASAPLGKLTNMYHVVCHPKRVNTLISQIKNSGENWILPKERIPPELRADFDSLKNVIHHPVRVSGDWSFGGSEGFSSPFNTALAMALNLAKFGGCSQVYLAGLDGFEAGDSRQASTASEIQSFELVSGVQILSLTPTTYSVETCSVYEQLA